jgi:outer membrane receptor protein involved in Fe transport
MALLLGWASRADASPLSGTVVDGDTLLPLAGATLAIEGTDLVAQTDEVGRYSFPDVRPGAIVVRVQAAGYETTDEHIELDEEGITDRVIVMLPPGVASETIEVIGKAPLVVSTPGQTELDREVLVKMPGARGDSMQVVKSLPGVANADAIGSGPGLLVIRGAAPEDSMFLLDGVQIPLVYHFFGLQSVVPSEFIDDIEFLPGGFGVEQGRATGGIVHIHTRPNRSTEWNGFAEVSFINVAGYVEGPLWREQNMSVAAAFRRSTIDFILPVVIPDDSNVSFTTAPQYYDGQLRVDWLPKSKHRVTMLALVSYDLLKLLSENENANDPQATGTFFNETGFSRLMTTWRYDGHEVDSTAVVSAGIGDFRVEIGADRYLDGEGSFLQAREDVVWRLHPMLALKVGGDAQANLGTFSAKFPLPPQEGAADMPNFTTDPLVLIDNEHFTDNRAAAYVAGDFNPIKPLTLTPGVRYDYYGRIDDHHLSPRLLGSYKLTPRWTGRFALGSYTRPLDQAESIPTDLEPELATQYVAGASYKIREGIEASSSAFYTDRRQLIVQDPSRIEQDATEAYVNRGYGNSYGAEILLRARTDRFFGWIAYTLSRGTRVDGPGQAERLFDYDQTHNLITVASWQWGKWSFGARWQYTTGEPDTPIEGSIYLSDFNTYVPVFGEVNTDRIEDAHQLDVRVDRKWTFEDWELSAYLDVTNVYAHARTLGYQYSFDYMEREAFTTLPIFPALGIRGAF